jgi:hypothetical protein
MERGGQIELGRRPFFGEEPLRPGDEIVEFPSRAPRLRELQARRSSGIANYLTLFANILKLASAIPEVGPALAIAGNAVSAAVSVGTPFSSAPNTTFQQTYTDIQGQIATIQQNAQLATLAQKHHVLSDYALLGTVGQLVGTQVWTLDEAGYLSANRQAFTLWTYQAFLPALWDMWEVENCFANYQLNGADTYLCTPPPDGPNISAYGDNGVTFSGLLPQQSPCGSFCDEGYCSFNCTFSTPSQTTLGVLFTPVSQECTHTPTGGAWVYADPSANPPVTGCTLGVGPSEMFQDQGGWQFQVSQVNAIDFGVEIGNQSRVTGVDKEPALRLRGRALMGIVPDLRSVNIAVHWRHTYPCQPLPGPMGTSMSAVTRTRCYAIMGGPMPLSMFS